MKVKVHCPCGAKFEFEVEPLNGRMPVAINCPTCGANATELADAVIAEQLTASPPVPPRVNEATKPRIHVTIAAAPAAVSPAAQSAPRPPTAQSGLRISKAAAAPTPAPEPVPEQAPIETAAPIEEGFEPCHRHKTEPAVDHCVVCGKPICEKCREQFGHVCSIFCREAAPHHGIKIPMYAGQRGQAEVRAERKVKYAVIAVAVVVALAFGGWAYYAFVAHLPHVVYRLPLPKSGSLGTQYELIAPNQLLSFNGSQLTLFDVSKGAPTWSATVPEAAGNDEATGGEFDAREPRLMATANDIWLALPTRVLRFDRLSGASKDLSLPENIRETVVGDDAILVLSGKPPAPQQVTRISLADGTMQSEAMTATVVALVAPATLSARGVGQPTTARGNGAAGVAGRLQGMATSATTEEPRPATPAAVEPPDASETRLVSAGDSAVQFGAKLLQHLTVTHEAMKKRGKSVLDDQNVTASQGIDLAEEMMNDQKRDETGGVDIEDVSRYQVTLHRLFAKGVTDWTGEVTGAPRFVSLKNVDLLVAGTNLHVFDKNNKNLWNATLTFLPRERESFRGADDLPCLETKDALYFADKGVLTRFDLFTGNVRWRMTTVGVSEITMSDDGGLYVDTSTATAESIRYSQQVDLKHRVDLVVMRVDPDSGKMLWSTGFDSTSYRVIPSGKFLYSTREWQTQDPLRMEDGPDNYFNIKLLRPATGDSAWNYPVSKKTLVKTEVQQNWILLQFADEVRVLKFFSF